MTAMPGQQDFPGGTWEETWVGTGIKVQVVQKGRPQVAAVSRTDKIVVALVMFVQK